MSFTASAALSVRKYRCIVSNAAGSVTSSAATLTVISKPTITTQPKDVSAVAGETATVSITASGTGLKYQWQFSTDGGATWKNNTSTGYNTASMTFTASASFNGRKYHCIVSNSAGSVTSSAAILTVVTKPTITAQPKSITASVGATAKFTVTATGAGLKYQWQYKYPDGSWTNSGYSSAKTATLRVPVLAKYNGIQYRCIITDANGKKLTSSAVTLTVR